MKTVTIAELRNGLDEYLKLVRAGEVVQIADEKGPFARLLPPVSSIDIRSTEAAQDHGTVPSPDDFSRRHGRASPPAAFLKHC